MYILFSFFGYTALAVVALLDKFIVSDKKVSPLVYSFYSTIPLILIFILLPFRVALLKTPLDYSIALASGITFGIALYAMYRGFEHSEVSHGGPLVGASIPFFTLFLGYFLLSERVSAVQLVAIGILIFGSLIISFEQTRKNRGWHRSMLWLVLSGLAYAASNVAAKYMYDHYGFYTGLVWTRGAIGIFGFALLAFASVRSALPWRIGKTQSTSAPSVPAERAKKIIIVGLDKTLGIVGVLLVQYAIATGSVSIVNALSGLQYAILIILVALLTHFAPRYFQEDYAKGEFVQEGLAVILISVGVAMLLV